MVLDVTQSLSDRDMYFVNLLAHDRNRHFVYFGPYVRHLIYTFIKEPYWAIIIIIIIIIVVVVVAAVAVVVVIYFNHQIVN